MTLTDAAIEINVDNAMYFDIGNVPGVSDEDARTDYFNSLSHRTVSSWATAVVDRIYVNWYNAETDLQKRNIIAGKRSKQKMNVATIGAKMEKIKKLANGKEKLQKA